jgi:hypothetical protein
MPTQDKVPSFSIVTDKVKRLEAQDLENARSAIILNPLTPEVMGKIIKTAMRVGEDVEMLHFAQKNPSPPEPWNNEPPTDIKGPDANAASKTLEPEAAVGNAPPVTTHEQEMDPKKRKEKDKLFIKKALDSFEAFHWVTNAQAQQFMTVNDVRGYRVTLSYNSSNIAPGANMNVQLQQQQQVIQKLESNAKQLPECYIFVFDNASFTVLEFLLKAAMRKSLKQLVGVTKNCAIFERYNF